MVAEAMVAQTKKHSDKRMLSRRAAELHVYWVFCGRDCLDIVLIGPSKRMLNRVYSTVIIANQSVCLSSPESFLS